MGRPHATYPQQAKDSLDSLTPRLQAAGFQDAAFHSDSMRASLDKAVPWLVDQTTLVDAGLDLAARGGLDFVPLGLPFPVVAIQHQLDETPGLVIAREQDGLIEIDALVAVESGGARHWLPMPSRGIYDPSSGDSWTRQLFDPLDDHHRTLNHRVPLQAARLAIGLMVALACRNIEPAVVKAPKALNAKRERRGKSRIPDHFVVSVQVDRKQTAKHTGRGERASPRPHGRRGYVRARTLTNGRRVVEWIGPSWVNGDAAPISNTTYHLT